MMIRTYTELIQFPTFLERYRYLRLGGQIGRETFGADRWINQDFYLSREWKDIRQEVIARDLGDLAIPDQGFGSRETIYVHHMNPITIDDIRNHSEFLLDPEYLIACSYDTHSAIHYGDESFLHLVEFVRRTPNDTCPWR